MELSPLEFIKKLRETDGYLTMLYTRGGCYKFALFIQEIYPKGILYIRKDHKHIVVSIENQFVDINGHVSDSENYTILTEKNIKDYKCEKWSSERNIILKDKKSRKKKEKYPNPVDSHLVINLLFFVLNCLFLAVLLLNSIPLLKSSYFLTTDIISRLFIVTLLIIMISIVSRKIVHFLNKICAYMRFLWE